MHTCTLLDKAQKIMHEHKNGLLVKKNTKKPAVAGQFLREPPRDVQSPSGEDKNISLASGKFVIMQLQNVLCLDFGNMKMCLQIKTQQKIDPKVWPWGNRGQKKELFSRENFSTRNDTQVKEQQKQTTKTNVVYAPPPPNNSDMIAKTWMILNRSFWQTIQIWNSLELSTSSCTVSAGKKNANDGPTWTDRADQSSPEGRARAGAGGPGTSMARNWGIACNTPWSMQRPSRSAIAPRDTELAPVTATKPMGGLVSCAWLDKPTRRRLVAGRVRKVFLHC